MFYCFHLGLLSEVWLVREFRRHQQLARRSGHHRGERRGGGVGRGLADGPGEPPDAGRVSRTGTKYTHMLRSTEPIKGPT